MGFKMVILSQAQGHNLRSSDECWIAPVDPQRSRLSSFVFFYVLFKVFDVQRKITYKNLANWYKELREYRPEIPCCVVANKIDGGFSFFSVARDDKYSAHTVIPQRYFTAR